MKLLTYLLVILYGIKTTACNIDLNCVEYRKISNANMYENRIISGQSRLLMLYDSYKYENIGREQVLNKT